MKLGEPKIAATSSRSTGCNRRWNSWKIVGGGGDGPFLIAFVRRLVRKRRRPAGRISHKLWMAVRRELYVHGCVWRPRCALSRGIDRARKYGSKLAAMAQFRKCSVRRRDAVSQQQSECSPALAECESKCALENRALSTSIRMQLSRTSIFSSHACGLNLESRRRGG
jgi:hypothetical protein